MATSKLERPSPLAWVRTHKVLFVFTVLVFAILGFLLYQKIALYENRRNFQQARLAIDSVYADIVRQIGQPDNYKRTNSCSRSYQEFSGYGDTTCDVDSSLIYGLSNRMEANQMLMRLQKIMNGLGESKTPNSSIEDVVVINSVYHEAQDYYNQGSLKCTAKYVYDTPQDTYLGLKSGPIKKTFFITFGCSGHARSAFYNLTN